MSVTGPARGKPECPAEVAWQRGTSPQALLDLLGAGASARKLRLFACACCWRIQHRFRDPRFPAAVELAERYADGGVRRHDFAAASRAICANGAFGGFDKVRWAVELTMQVGAEWQAAKTAAGVCQSLMAEDTLDEWNFDDLEAHRRLRQAEGSVQADLLRDVFGNPFRRVAIDPVWLTPAVAKLAQVIYDEKAFDRLPLVAAALVRAGCTDETLLGHCRHPGPHARGCWAVDLLLGKC